MGPHAGLAKAKAAGKPAKALPLVKDPVCKGKPGTLKTLSCQEVDRMLDQLPKKKAPGPDGVPYELLSRLGPRGRARIRETYSRSLTTATVPSAWKKERIKPMLKPNKPDDDPPSYRPIALTSCISKGMECLVEGRLKYYLMVESRRPLDKRQGGFRRGRTIEEHTYALTIKVRQGFAKGKLTGALFVDFKGAFQRAWRAGTLWKLAHRHGVPKCVVAWLREFLRDRVASVVWQGSESSCRRMMEGTGQGTKNAPGLFDILTDDIAEYLEVPGMDAVDAQLWADDLLIIEQSETEKQLVQQMQARLDRLTLWEDDWRLPISEVKTEFTIFRKGGTDREQVRVETQWKEDMQCRYGPEDAEQGLDVLEVEEGGPAHQLGLRPGMRITKATNLSDDKGKDAKATCEEVLKGAADNKVEIYVVQYPPLRLRDRHVKYTVAAKYLGILYDEALTFAPHVAAIAAAVEKRIGLLRRLTGTTWGCRKKTLRATYITYVRAKIDTAPAAWQTFCGDELNKLEVLQNEAARIITGCPYGTQTQMLLHEAGLMPLSTRATLNLVLAEERFARLPEGCPARDAVERGKVLRAPTRPGPSATREQRITGAALRATAAQELRRQAGLNDTRREPLVLHTALPPWGDYGKVNVNPKLVVEVEDKEDEDELIRAVEETLAKLPPHEYETWTDGSAKGGVRDGGAGVVHMRRDEVQDRVALAVGPIASSYACEMRAMQEAFACLNRYAAAAKNDGAYRQNVILTDSQSVCARLKEGPQRVRTKAEERVWRGIAKLSETVPGVMTTIQYIPSHLDNCPSLRGNHLADEEAKRGGKQPQADCAIDWPTARAALRRAAATQNRETSWGKLPDDHWFMTVMGDKGFREQKKADLPRIDEVQLAQLRTNTFTSLGHYQWRISKAETKQCSRCGAERDDAWHFLAQCKAFKKQRKEAFDGKPKPNYLIEEPTRVANYLRACRDTLSDGRERGKRAKEE
eukprot:gene38657-60873_t